MLSQSRNTSYCSVLPVILCKPLGKSRLCCITLAMGGMLSTVSVRLVSGEYPVWLRLEAGCCRMGSIVNLNRFLSSRGERDSRQADRPGCRGGQVLRVSFQAPARKPAWQAHRLGDTGIPIQCASSLVRLPTSVPGARPSPPPTGGGAKAEEHLKSKPRTWQGDTRCPKIGQPAGGRAGGKAGST